MDGFVTEIFDVLGKVVSGFANLLITMFNSIVGIFFKPGVGEAPGEITFLGALLLFSAATGLVIWGINFIRRLIRLRTRD